MKIFKRGATFGKDEQPLGEFIFWLSLMGVVAAISGAWHMVRLAMIGASWIPFPPLQWLGLSAAVSQGRLKSVQRLAKPSVFKTMPWFFNNEIVHKSGEKATGYTTLECKEIFNTLLRNGAVVTQKSFSGFTLYHLLENPQRAQLSIQCNAIHDDTKYEMFMYCMTSGSTLLNQLTELMLVQWADFFEKLQENSVQHEQLWKNIVHKNSPILVEKLVGCTPAKYLTAEKLYAIFERSNTTRNTFDALISKGVDIDTMLEASAHTNSRVLKFNSEVSDSCAIIERIQRRWLEQNPSLKEVVEHSRNIKQKNRLMDSIDSSAYETPLPPHEQPVEPILQRKRKM